MIGSIRKQRSSYCHLNCFIPKLGIRIDIGFRNDMSNYTHQGFLNKNFTNCEFNWLNVLWFFTGGRALK